jgi:Ca2+-dependent lipid-binding protein
MLKTPIVVNSLKELQSEPFESLVDLDFKYDGSISANIESTLNINLTVKEYKIKCRVIAKITQFYAVARICLVPMKYGKSWMSFVSPPAVKMTVTPTFGDKGYDINNLPHIKSTISEHIDMVFTKMVYPNKTEIDFPLTC